MVIPRKHLHDLKTSRKRIRQGWRFKRFWVVECKRQPCSVKHIYLDEQTAKFAADFIEASQSSKVMLFDNGS